MTDGATFDRCEYRPGFDFDQALADAKTLKDAAVIYARGGWRVFPVHIKNGNKQPMLKGWQKSASTDPMEVAETWYKYPRALIGFAIPETVVVLDIDVGHVEDQDGFADFVRLHGVHPDEVLTAQSRSERGGRHLFFHKSPAEEYIYKNRGHILDAAIDVKTVGGFVILPGPGGNRIWVKSPTIGSLPVPEWVKTVPNDAPVIGEARPFTGDNTYGRNVLAKVCDNVANAKVGARDNTVYFAAIFCGRLVAGGVLEEGPAFKALLDAAKKIDPPLMSEFELAAKIKRGMKAGAEKPLNAPDEGEAKVKVRPNRPDTLNDKPVIELTHGQPAEHIDEVEQHLVDKELYQGDGQLVRLDKVRAKDRNHREILVPGIVALDGHQLFDEASRHIQFVQYSEKFNTYVPANWNHTYAQILLGRGGRLKFPVLKGFANTPIVLPDGKVFMTPGYDATTGQYYDPLGVAFPPVPEKLTKDDAIVALKTLGGPLSEYPFKGLPYKDDLLIEPNVNRSVALAYLLTITNRQAWDQVPGFAFSGNVRGVGKGKLVAIGSVVATGETPAVVRQGLVEGELEKNMATLMLAGVSHLAIDNASQTLEGDLLDQVLTEDRIFIRVFGKLKGRRIPNTFIVTATGNKLILSGDAGRRWLICYIETQSEYPEHDDFPFDPVAYAREHRGELVVATVIILKAYIDAGRPCDSQVFTLGSFENWSRDVRGALIWLGEEDPVMSMTSIRANDPAINLEVRLVELLAEKLKDGSAITSANLIKDAKVAWEKTQRNEKLEGMDEINLQLNEAIKEATKGSFNARDLGWILRRASDKWIGGKKLIQWKSSGYGAEWKVVGR
jgi:hypothetical protein